MFRTRSVPGTGLGWWRHDRGEVPDARGWLAGEAAVACEDLGGEDPGRERHRACAQLGEKVGVEDYEQLVELLQQDERDADEIARWASRYCVRLQESAGVDVIWDGEQQRSEMYGWAVAHANGFEPRGTVRSFDNKYYLKSAATGPISLAEPYHNDEFSFLQSVAKHDLKIPITGAYTIAVWSYDEHHSAEGGRLGGGLSRKDEVEARRELTLDIARNLIRPNLEALIELGATWIQIDEPSVHGGGRARHLRRELQRLGRGPRGPRVLDAPLLLGLRPLLPRDRGNERLSPVLRRLCELRHPRARHLGGGSSGIRGDLQVARSPTTRSSASACSTSTPTSSSPRARARPDPVRRRDLRRSCADPCLPGLRTPNAKLGRRLREAAEHGRGHASRRGVSEPDARRSDVGPVELAAESATIVKAGAERRSRLFG